MTFDPDTALGGRQDRFPTTRQSVLRAAASGESGLRSEAFSVVVTAYWKPVYKYVRVRWRKSNDQAKDLTQEFFAGLLDRNALERYDPARAAFRTYLRTCVDNFLRDHLESAGRLKRGGGIAHVSLDFESAERELAMQAEDARASMEDFFEREWQRHLFALGIEDLRERCRAEGKQIRFDLFARYDLADGDRPSYEALAREHGLPVTTVTNHLAWARRELRRLVLDRLAAITGSDGELRREARRLLSPV